MIEHNIVVQGGTTTRLLTAGKYCDRDILVTAEGGSLSLDVVTASALPSAVVDGQIVVITDTTPGTVYIDTDEPASPVSGDVWVKVESNSVGLILTEQSPYLRSGLTEAYQWNGSAWGAHDGYVGIAGVWTQFAMVLPPVGTALNDFAWDQIAAVSNRGLASTYFKVGDTKQIVINGTIGAATFSNVSVWAVIVGIDHNSSAEGTNRIHFQIGKSAQTNGVNICLISDKYWEATNKKYFNMNLSATNSGGWQSSYMRNTLLGNSNTPDNPLASSLMAALPAELRAVMKGVTKYTDNKGSGSDTASNVTTTTDYLWIPAEFEFMGAQSRANSAEKNYQVQYEYYAAGNTTVQYSHKATTSAMGFWTRSPVASNATNFCTGTSTNKGTSASNANYSIGINPCFAV